MCRSLPDEVTAVVGERNGRRRKRKRRKKGSMAWRGEAMTGVLFVREVSAEKRRSERSSLSFCCLCHNLPATSAGYDNIDLLLFIHRRGGRNATGLHRIVNNNNNQGEYGGDQSSSTS